MSKHYILYFILFTFPILGISQIPFILLQNPSLEDEPGSGRTPQGWFYCGEIGESPPDVHPLGLFGVGLQAQHGSTYVGMVVRDNGTWEGLSQWLSQPLQAGKCYEFSICVARSPKYQSLSRITWQLTNYDRAVVLRIWGGNLNCEKTELLAVSNSIESVDWQRISLQLKPRQSYNRMVIEAYYTQTDKPYCGNILIDHASPIIPINCETGQLAIFIDTLKNIANTVDIESLIANESPKITFLEVDDQPEQHVFFLPSGELVQGNRYLYVMAQAFKDNFNNRLIFNVIEEDKKRFQSKYDKLRQELILLGLNSRQFRIQKYRPRKAENVPKVEVLIEVE